MSPLQTVAPEYADQLLNDLTLHFFPTELLRSDARFNPDGHPQEFIDRLYPPGFTMLPYPKRQMDILRGMQPDLFKKTDKAVCQGQQKQTQGMVSEGETRPT